MQLNKKAIVRTALFAVLVGALGYSFVAKSETKLIPFQGKLTDASGQVISDGAIVVQFKMYDAPVGGQAKWNGEVQMLSVNGGLVNTTLGTKASLKNVDFSSPTYLEITIDANGDNEIGPEDPPLLPRQCIVPAVYAVEAGNSKTMGGHDWSSIFGTNDPTGKIPGNKLADKGITAAQIANNTITAQQIKDSTITSVKIANKAIKSNQIDDKAVTSIQLADGAVNTAQVADGAIKTAKIATNSITTELLADRGMVYAYETIAPIGSVARSEGIPNNFRVPTTDPTYSKLPGSTVKLKTSGRPVVVMLQHGYIRTLNGGAIVLGRNGSDVNYVGIASSGQQATHFTCMPSSVVSFIDTPPAGEYEYSLYVTENPGTIEFSFRGNPYLVAFEL